MLRRELRSVVSPPRDSEFRLRWCASFRGLRYHWVGDGWISRRTTVTSRKAGAADRNRTGASGSTSRKAPASSRWLSRCSASIAATFMSTRSSTVTVTEVSYGTNRGELYMTVAFSNGGNRDAAVLRVEPALWVRRDNANPQWVPVVEPVDPQNSDRRAADAARRQVRRCRGAEAVDAAERQPRRRRRWPVIAGRRFPRDPRGDDELRRQPVSARASCRPSGS